MTGREYVVAVKDHLGDRQTGVIGSRQVDDAVLASVNKARLYLAKRIHFHELQESIALTITTADHIYALPSATVSTTTGAVPKIKDILRVEQCASGETTGRPLRRITRRMIGSMYPVMTDDRTSRPYYYSLFGLEINFYPWPDGDYTETLICDLFPTTLLMNDTEDGEIPIEFDSCVESYATFDCFAKLQQTQDAATWFKIFWEDYKATVGLVRKQPDWEPDMAMVDNIGRNLGYEPGLDPFVRSMSGF